MKFLTERSMYIFSYLIVIFLIKYLPINKYISFFLKFFSIWIFFSEFFFSLNWGSYSVPSRTKPNSSIHLLKWWRGWWWWRRSVKYSILIGGCWIWLWAGTSLINIHYHITFTLWRNHLMWLDNTYSPCFIRCHVIFKMITC